jgi:hypothetical protein
MKITLDDLVPGATYVAWNQTVNITPHGCEVQPLTIDHSGRFIRYRIATGGGGSRLGETTIERFLEIINAPQRPQGQNLLRFNP